MKKAKQELETVFTSTNVESHEKGDQGKGLWNFDEKDETVVSQISDMFSASIPIDDKSKKVAFMIISQTD